MIESISTPSSSGSAVSSSLPAEPVAKTAPVVLTPNKAAVAPLVSSSKVAAGVNTTVGAGMKPPSGLSRGSTRQLENAFFHGLIYGETDARKTSTAAAFSGPENTLFLLTRGAEQLMPVRDEGFQYIQASDGAALSFALQFPERAALWAAENPELTDRERKILLNWPNQTEKTLIIDDTTEGANQLVDDNRTNDEGKELKDGRKIYGNTNIAFRDLLNALKRKPMHTIFIALSKVTQNSITNEETVAPDLSSGIRSLLTAEMEYVFYLQKHNWKMLTKESFFQYTKLNDKGRPETFKRNIFAKNKMPLSLALKVPPVVAKEEPMDLRALWEKIKKESKKG